MLSMNGIHLICAAGVYKYKQKNTDSDQYIREVIRVQKDDVERRPLDRTKDTINTKPSNFILYKLKRVTHRNTAIKFSIGTIVQSSTKITMSLAAKIWSLKLKTPSLF
jgi:DNA-binding HxlR family transcriptional regulator